MQYFFKNEKEIKVLSKITYKNEKIIKTNSFENINFNNENMLDKLILQLKIVYEGFLERKQFN